MILGIDYRFRDDITGHDTIPIEVLLLDYKGVIVRYTVVKVVELENGTAKLQFAYDILEPGSKTETSLRSDATFEQTLGLILNTMILEFTGDLDTNDDITREDYSEDSDTERGIL